MPDAPPRAVLDTSVLYAHRRRVALVELAQSGRFEGIWSAWVVAELNRVLTWRWAERYGIHAAIQRQASDAAKEMMRYLLAAFTLIEPPLPYPVPWPQLTDMGDAPVYATAVAARTHYVVSDDVRHAPPPDVATGRRVWNEIEYVTYDQFTRLFA